jgi:hypothetical protein
MCHPPLLSAGMPATTRFDSTRREKTVADTHRMTHHVVRPMGTIARLFHWSAIAMTLGLWHPVYSAARKAHGEIS